jgi:hypothetical protein
LNESSDFPNRRSALVVTVEGLGTNLMGCYGNAIAPTPHWDRLAATSLVADQFWMDGCDATNILESIWSGTHSSQRREGIQEDSREKVLRSPGLFVSDDPEAVRMAERWLPGDALLVQLDESELAAFPLLVESSITEWHARLESHAWLWIHSRGLRAPWDAPYEYRLTMCDEGDPDPPTETQPPNAVLNPDSDPDVLFGWSCGAGAQAIAMDEVWEWIMATLVEMGLEDECMILLAGIQGYPLGEHQQVGLGSTTCEGEQHPSLYAERLHCPLVIRPGTLLPLGLRIPQFIQPHQIGTILDDWVTSQPSSGQDSSIQEAGDSLTLARLIPMAGWQRSQWPAQHRSAMAWCGSEMALMVPSWSARWRPPSQREIAVNYDSFNALSALQGELFAMPDDRWQQNEVSLRAPEILDLMASLRDAWTESYRDDHAKLHGLLMTLEDALWKPVR